jgi:hypothetical protein
MPCGHGYGCQTKAVCKTRQAFGQVVVEFNGADELPTASLNDCLGSCGIASVEVVKEFTTLVAGECAAYKVKVVYEPCFFAVGLPPLIQVSTAAPDEHDFDAEVRQISDISNGQCLYFRVALRTPLEAQTCYPACAGASSVQPVGVVAFSILAYQGGECQ